jgi:hypothetical protein
MIFIDYALFPKFEYITVNGGYKLKDKVSNDSAQILMIANSRGPVIFYSNELFFSYQ